MKCLDCDKKFSAGSSDEMMQAMMPHYQEDHKEMMEGNASESKEEWFTRFNKEWEGAKEI